MLTLYILFVIFFVTPAIMAVAYRVADANNYIENNGRIDLNKEDNKFQFCLAVIISICIYIIGILTVYKLLDKNLSITAIALPFITLTLASIILFISTFKTLKIYKKVQIPFNITMAYLSLWITWAAGSFAWESISTTTDLSPNEFPSAVLGFTLLLAPILWALVIAVFLLILYGITGIAILTMPKIEAAIKEKGNKRAVMSRYFILTSLFFGLALSPTFTINFMQTIVNSKWIENRLDGILMFSGYPLNKHKCVTSKSDNDRFAILTSQKIAVAEYISEHEYKFFTVECPKEEAK